MRGAERWARDTSAILNMQRSPRRARNKDDLIYAEIRVDSKRAVRRKLGMKP
jgi:hypothetical protein